MKTEDIVHFDIRIPFDVRVPSGNILELEARGFLRHDEPALYMEEIQRRHPDMVGYDVVGRLLQLGEQQSPDRGEHPLVQLIYHKHMITTGTSENIGARAWRDKQARRSNDRHYVSHPSYNLIALRLFQNAGMEQWASIRTRMGWPLDSRYLALCMRGPAATDRLMAV